MYKNFSSAAFLIIISCLIWGIQPLFVKILVQEFVPIPVVSIRYLVVSTILFLIMLYRHEALVPPRSVWLPLFTMGFLGVCINNVTQFMGLQYSSVSHSTIISALTPVITALLSYLLIKERLHRIQWLGISISLMGALYLISKGSFNIILTLNFNIGDILFFISQTAWALYSIIVVRIIDRISAYGIVAWSGLLGACMTATYGIATNTFIIPETLSPLAWLSYLIVIFGGGLIAMIFWNKGTGVIGPSQAAIFMNLMPLAGILCGTIFLNEVFLLSTAIGGALILIGVYLTTQYQKLISHNIL